MIGSTISHYQILEKLGEGGMGVVYRAEDSKLDRAVALKFLPPHLLGNEDVRKRFEREAKAAASLHHANICPVFEIDDADGKAFISMALIEGESLDKKIAQGPLKLNDALDIAQQIARGIEAAHKKGIFHRDIKPENVMVGDDGHVTIMDFGLAQLTEASRLTKKDETLGTIYYMSPEQAEGSGTDHRTDIWALGVVIYEMVTGQHPFKGDYDQAILYSVLNEAPEPMTALRTGVPMELEIFVGKCLAKTLSERYSSAGELATDLRAAADRLQASGATKYPTQLRAADRDPVRRAWFGSLSRERAAWSVGLALALAVIGAQRLSIPSENPDSTPRYFAFTFDDYVTAPVVSPDGKHIAYVRQDGATAALWVQDLDKADPRKIAEGVRSSYPSIAWSPDGRDIAYGDQRDVIFRVPSGGGPTQKLLDGTGTLNGLSWFPDGGSIAFGTNRGSGERIYAVSAGGGSPEELFESDDVHPDQDGHEPYFLPGESAPALLYTFHDAAGAVKIAARDLVSNRQTILADGRIPVYSPTGHVIYENDRALWALPFSATTLEATGPPFLVREEAAFASVAADGSLVYLPTGAGSELQLVWVDGEGRELGTIGQPQTTIRYLELSPDDRRVAVSGSAGDGLQIWLHDVDRSVKTRLTFSQDSPRRPLWSASGRQILYSGGAANRSMGVYRMAADGSGEAQLVYGDEAMNIFASDESADGAYIVFDRTEPDSSTADIWYLERSSEGSYEAKPFLAREFSEKAGTLSPDKRWLGYVSDETGQFEIYVQKFPEGGSKQRISTEGGSQPRWSNNGRKLYFVSNGTLFGAEATPGAELKVGAAESVLQSHWLRLEGVLAYPQYDVSSDDRRFVIKRSLNAFKSTIRITENWIAEYREH